MRHRIGIASIRAVLAVFLVLQFTALSAAAETVTVPGRWIGRVDETKAAFGWPGSGFALRFEGRRLVLRLADTGGNHLAAMIDGTLRRIDLGPGDQSYTVFDGADGTHEVEILKRTEGDVGTVRFLGARTDGRFLSPEPPRRRLLVVGDSISAGYGIEGVGPHCPFSPETENQTLTYAGETARRFAAEATVLAASGRGVVRNYDGAPGATMPDLMDQALPGVPRPSGPAQGPFDLVLVHLGTNDFSGTEDPDGFGKAYGALLETLRARYGQAPIYALLGPMLGPERFAQASEAIEAAVTARREAGDEAVRFLAFPPPPASFGCDWHPGTLAHLGIADALAARLRTDLGW